MSDEHRNPIASPEVAHVSPPLPGNARAVLRVTNEFFLRSVNSMAAMAGDDLIRALVYTAMWTANVKHITNTHASNVQYAAIDEIPPDEMRQPCSVMVISNTLRIPYETVRRYVHALLKQGACVRVDRKGFIVPAAVLGQQAQRDEIRANYPSLLRFLADLQRVVFDFSPYRHRLPQTVPIPAEGAPTNARALLRVAIELVMHGIDLLGTLHDNDFLYALIFTAIWTSNVSQITATADNLKYGALHDLPPDEQRKPVTVHAVATALRIPYETARRYANKMVKDGSAVRAGNKGLIVPRTRLAIDAGYDGVRIAYVQVERMVGGLHRAGFDFSGY